MKIKHIIIVLFIIDAALITINWLTGNLIDNYQIFCGLSILIMGMTNVIIEKIDEVNDNTLDCVKSIVALCKILKGEDNKDE